MYSTVKYQTISYIEDNLIDPNQPSADGRAINNVVTIINGSIESVLHLIGYSFEQIKQMNGELTIKYCDEDKQVFEVSGNDVSNDTLMSRPTRAHLVVDQNSLFGVIVDNGLATICGLICEVIPKQINNQNPAFLRGLKIIDKTLEKLSHNEEIRRHIESGQHIAIVGQKGSLFITKCNENLTLVLDNGFVLLHKPVQWIRTKQHLRGHRRASTQLAINESIVVSHAAIDINDNGVSIYGPGSVVNIKTIKEFYDFNK